MSHDTQLEGAVAVVAMAGRFPQAPTLEDYWRIIHEGVDAFTQLTDEQLLASGVGPSLLRQPGYVRRAALLDRMDQFDAAFFGFSPREAEVLDPQHRLFLECAHEALERAGHGSERARGRVGVFASASLNSYYLHSLHGNARLREVLGDFQLAIANDKDFLPTRVSYKLGLRGPSVAVQTACSSSLVAVHLACQSLLNGECALALAGGSSLSVPQAQGYLYQEGGIASPDGYCRPFDAAAAGTNRGNGVGVVLLKLLEEALADGDTIHAVIRGSAVNNDGAHKIGYTAPSVEGQASVISEALEVAAVSADSIGYVEAHGTATALGDPIEVQALTRAFRKHTERRGYCALGSVKANIGHLDAAAGIASLIKAVLVLERRQLPPCPHFTSPNPRIDFERSPFYVSGRGQPWEPVDGPRRAGVSSFGIGGTNVHVVLEEAPPRPAPRRAARPYQLLPLSARTERAREEVEARLREHLRQQPQEPLEEVAHTLQVGRRHMAWRTALVSSSPAQAVELLERRRPEALLRGQSAAQARSVAFLLPGQGSQYVGMGAALHESEAPFREQVDLCAGKLQGVLGLDVRRLLYPGPREREWAQERLRETRVCQPVLFTVEYALARLLEAWGIRPTALLGHSLGEYVAACLAGVFSLEEALEVVAARGQLMGSMPPGGMLAVGLPAQEVEPLLPAALALAAHNSPQACVVAGPTEPLAELRARLEQRGIACTPLAVSHAFHSPMMEPAVAPFVARLRRMHLRPPSLPFISNVTGTWIEAEEATSPEYWGRHLLQPVRFAQGLERLCEGVQPRLLLEVGPGHTLGRLAARQSSGPVQVVSTLGSSREESSEVERLLTAIGRLWVEGAEVDWAGLHRGERRRRAVLPTYPFEHQRYWVETAPQPSPPERPGTPAESPVTSSFYVPGWSRAALPSAAPSRRVGRLLLLAEAHGWSQGLAERLRARGHSVTLVEPGERLERLTPEHWRLPPGRREDFQRLLEDSGELPSRVLHLWLLGSSQSPQERGFYTLLALAQALGAHGTRPAVELTVVTDQLYAVAEGEPIQPLKALLQGPASVLPQELPGCTCRLVDMALPPGGVAEELLERLVAEVESTASERSVAYRGAARWVREFVPVPLPPPEPSQLPLRQRGVYLIVGGLGGVGLALAEHLARRVSARLVLTGRSPTPPRESWSAWLGTPTRLRLSQELEWLRGAAEQIEHQRPLHSLADSPGLEESLRLLCASYLYHFLFPLQAPLRLGEPRAMQALRERLGLQPGFERLFSFMIGTLEQAKLIRVGEGMLEGQVEPAHVPTPRALHERLLEGYPEVSGLLELLEHCVRHYPEVLRGSLPALSVLYPSGRSEEDSARSGVEWSSMGQCVALLRHFLARHAERTQGRTLRILEVGGGSGVVLQALLPLLRHHPVEYHFTDIGPSFVRAMEGVGRRQGLTFLHTSVLDISRPPPEQGHPPGSYDLVIALNVVHATPRVPQSLAHLESLLVPGGHLCLVETVKQQPWVDMIWGLAEGWWSYEDELRTRSPLLEVGDWEHALRDVGFAEVEVLPAAVEQRSRWDNVLLIAQRPGESGLQPVGGRAAMQERIRRLRAIEEAGGEVLPLVADVTDRERMGEVLAEVKRRHGALHGVIHAALVLEDGLMQLKTRESAGRVLASKVEGTLVLDELLRDEPLDFFVLCSSLSALLGALGQADYAAASAFLDAYAHSQRGRTDRRTISMDWDRWLEVGAAMRLGLGLAAGALGLQRTAPGEYTVRWQAERCWWLDEHRLEGRATLPGVAYLELVRAALVQELGEAPVELEQLVLLSLLEAPAGEEVEVRFHLRPEDEGYALEIRSRAGGLANGGWRSHAMGRVRMLPRGSARPTHPLRELEERLGLTQAPREHEPAQGPRELAPALGRRWSSLSWHRAWKGEEGLALIELPEELAEDLRQWPLHPALLDAATGFAPLPPGAWLPLSYGNTRIHGPLPRQLYSHIRRLEPASAQAGVVRLEVRLMDGEGRELLCVEEFVLRRVEVDSLARPQPAGKAPRQAVLPRPGALDSLRLQPLERLPPQEGEVEVQVLAAGLNFKDALLALGALPVELANGAPLALGVECAGIISAVGPGVRGLRVGEAVVAAAAGAFASHVRVPQEQVFPKPAGLSFEQAAMVPVTLFTAWYALEELARLRAGEHVLIHAAATGVGLAGVKLALRRGATVYATAGSEPKRELLRSLGVTLAMDSRAPGFDDQLLQHTQGRGVDVVLNSLSGEFLSRSLGVLARHGRFVELGVRDMLSGGTLPLAPFERGLTFLAAQIDPGMKGYRELMGEALRQIERGELEPLPYTAWPLERVAEALQLVSKGRHVGKVVLTPEEPLSRPPALPSSSRPVQPRAGVAIVGLRSAEGCEAFERILAAGLPQVAVSTRELRARMAEIERLRVSSWEPALPSVPRGSPARTERSKPYVAPRTERERALAALWQDLLGVSEVGLDDDFFELKGDSLLAIQLMGRLRKELEVELPLSSFLARPTLRTLLSAMPAPATDEPASATGAIPAAAPQPSPAVSSEPARKWRHLVPIQPQGESPPFFWAAPLMGTVFPYFTLARCLAPTHPFYALQPPGLQEGQEPMDKVEELAALYVRELRELQPRGPYRLGGWSFGCVVAYEVALQLEAAGEQVALLSLLDFPAPSGQRASLWATARFFSGSVLRGLAPYTLDYLYLAARAPLNPDAASRLSSSLTRGWERLRKGGLVQELLDHAAMARVVPEDSRLLLLREPGIAPMLRLTRAHQRAMLSYRPRGRLRQRIVLFRTSEQAWSFARDLGWGALSASGVDVREAPGDHMTLLRPPHVERVAEQLRALLSSAPLPTRR
uniref:TubF protein n=1 Tax=Archangium disciforme TaxID=38 RepID=Q5ZPA6_9BACT|nr:TubF protein [Archangium disciforme]